MLCALPAQFGVFCFLLLLRNLRVIVLEIFVVTLYNLIKCGETMSLLWCTSNAPAIKTPSLFKVAVYSNTNINIISTHQSYWFFAKQVKTYSYSLSSLLGHESFFLSPSSFYFYPCILVIGCAFKYYAENTLGFQTKNSYVWNEFRCMCTEFPSATSISCKSLHTAFLQEPSFNKKKYCCAYGPSFLISFSPCPPTHVLYL